MVLIKTSTGFIPLNKVARITECIMLNIIWKWNINKIKCIHKILKIMLNNREHSRVKPAFYHISLFTKPWTTHVRATVDISTRALSWALRIKHTSVLRAGSVFPFPSKCFALEKGPWIVWGQRTKTFHGGGGGGGHFTDRQLLFPTTTHLKRRIHRVNNSQDKKSFHYRKKFSNLPILPS